MKKLLYATTLIILAISVMLIPTHCSAGTNPKPPEAVSGVLDLSGWIFSRDGTVDLNGEWEFYWKSLLSPDDFMRGQAPEPTAITEFPAVWNTIRVNGNRLPAKGYATYRLKIIHSDPGEIRHVHIPYIFTAYRLWVNGRIVAENGKVGTSAETSSPRHMPIVCSIQTDSPSLNIVLQISNFHHARGGVRKSITLGNEPDIHRLTYRSLIYEIFLFGAMFIMGLYHIIIYLQRRNDMSALFIGIICIIFSLRTSLTGEVFMVQLFQNLDWALQVKTEFFSAYVSPPLFVAFLYSLYPEDCPGIIYRFFIIAAIAFTGLIAFASTYIMTKILLSAGSIVLLLAAAACIYLVIKASLNKREGARIIMIGFFIMGITLVNDILYTGEIINTGFYTHTGVFIFILFQAGVLSLRFSNAFSRAQRLSEDIRETEKQYRDIFENSTNGIFQLSAENLFMNINPALAGILGYDSPRELMSSTILQHDLFGNVEDENILMEMILNNREIMDYEMRVRSKKGELINVSVNAHSVLDESGKIKYYLGIIEDITQRKKTEEMRIARDAAEAATRAKSDFLARMSHEIRTPMNAIIGMTDLALQEDSESERKEYLLAVKESTNHLLTIVSDILDFSKIEAGKVQLEQSAFDLFQAVETSVRTLSQDAAEKGLEIISSVSDDTPRFVIGDRTRLVQILINLISNAIKFTENGAIHISVCRRDPDSIDNLPDNSVPVTFSVSDSGIGIPENEIETIFDSFSQISSEGPARHGTGLGLSIADQLVTLMQGNIMVESEYGKGSKFTFYSIFRKADNSLAEIMEPERPAEKTPALKNRFSRSLDILLVEDNMINVRLAKTVLEKLGHRVRDVHNGRDSLSMLSEEHFDLVLMDIELPGMDGIEATRRIRKGEAGMQKSQIPVIAMTAHVLPEFRNMCFKAGMDDYISKPIRIHDLNDIIMRVTGNKNE